MPKLFSIDVKVYATAYIVADTQEEAQAIANGLKDGNIEEHEIYGGSFHSDMPEISFSPAMSIYGADEGVTVDEVDDFADENDELEHCDDCANELEPQQIGLCDSCQELRADDA